MTLYEKYGKTNKDICIRFEQYPVVLYNYIKLNPEDDIWKTIPQNIKELSTDDEYQISVFECEFKKIKIKHYTEFPEYASYKNCGIINTLSGIYVWGKTSNKDLVVLDDLYSYLMMTRYPVPKNIWSRIDEFNSTSIEPHRLYLHNVAYVATNCFHVMKAETNMLVKYFLYEGDIYVLTKAHIGQFTIKNKFKNEEGYAYGEYVNGQMRIFYTTNEKIFPLWRGINFTVDTFAEANKQIEGNRWFVSDKHIILYDQRNIIYENYNDNIYSLKGDKIPEIVDYNVVTEKMHNDINLANITHRNRHENVKEELLRDHESVQFLIELYSTKMKLSIPFTRVFSIGKDDGMMLRYPSMGFVDKNNNTYDENALYYENAEGMFDCLDCFSNYMLHRFYFESFRNYIHDIILTKLNGYVRVFVLDTQKIKNLLEQTTNADILETTQGMWYKDILFSFDNYKIRLNCFKYGYPIYDSSIDISIKYKLFDLSYTRLYNVFSFFDSIPELEKIQHIDYGLYTGCVYRKKDITL